MLCNQRLAELVSSHIGKGWITDLTKLRAIESRVDDDRFCAEWRKIKFENKVKLTEYIMEKCGVTVNLASMFDVQV